MSRKRTGNRAVGAGGKGLTRRELLGDALRYAAAGAVGMSVAAAFSCRRPAPRANAVVVLGMDGLDPDLLKRFMAAGHLPNFARLIKDGWFSLLRTTWPPQSPTAWSTFITGKNPGGHGVFDMVTRDPADYSPQNGLTRFTTPPWVLKAGRWQVPLVGSGMQCQRAGVPFWDRLCAAGVPASLYKLPADFPPGRTGAHTLAGLGVTDLTGAIANSFSYYTDDPPPRLRSEEQRVYMVAPEGGRVVARLYGPPSPWKRTGEKLSCPFLAHISGDRRALLIEVGKHRLLVREKEWSEWVEIAFQNLPSPELVHATVRFYVKELSPHFRLYASPLNISPLHPALPISSPDGFAADIAREVGMYYTQGLPTDYSARIVEVLDDDGYRAQTDLVWEEERRLFDYAWSRFDGGFLFFYFALSDLNAHMFWRALDPEHPAYTPELGRRHGDVILTTYRRLDGIVERVLDGMPSTTLIILSDHGFGPLNASFDVNRWLEQKGLLTFKPAAARAVETTLKDADWTRTAVYQMGYNAIYINKKGREGKGIVPQADVERLRRRLQTELEAVVDSASGRHPISRVVTPEEVYVGAYVKDAPELIIGYSRGYRTYRPQGSLGPAVIAVNKGYWSGDHLIDPALVPGVLISNRRILSAEPRMEDIGPSVCRLFGAPADGMDGRPVLEPT